MSGRPRLYDDPMVMEAKIDQYFDGLEEGSNDPPTIAGLCLFLGFCDRKSLDTYKGYEGFSPTVSRAKLRIEADRSKRLAVKDLYTPGLPMDLAANHGWVTERSDNRNTHDVNVSRVKWETVKAPESADDVAE